MLSTLLTALLIIDCLVIILLIIALQQGNEGGIGSAFGSGNSAGFFGASGGVTLIVRATWIAGAIFFVTTLSLAWVKTSDHFGVGKQLEIAVPGVATPAPAPTAVASPVASPVGATTPAPAASPATSASPVPVP